MALSREVREDAKRYNAEWQWFEGVCNNTGDVTEYRSYGVAYRYVNEKVRRGANMAIVGCRVVGSLEGGLRTERVTLCSC